MRRFVVMRFGGYSGLGAERFDRPVDRVTYTTSFHIRKEIGETI